MVKFFVAWAAVFSFTQQSQASHLEHQRQAVRREGVPQCGISYLNLGQVGHLKDGNFCQQLLCDSVCVSSLCWANNEISEEEFFAEERRGREARPAFPGCWIPLFLATSNWPDPLDDKEQDCLTHFIWAYMAEPGCSCVVRKKNAGASHKWSGGDQLTND